MVRASGFVTRSSIGSANLEPHAADLVRARFGPNQTLHQTGHANEGLSSCAVVPA
jgi:hypothetical protein